MTSTPDSPQTTPKPGQVWRPHGTGGMWRTVKDIHPAGVEWTSSPDDHGFDQWETWAAWVRETGAVCHAE